jgi:hypothetical protein
MIKAIFKMRIALEDIPVHAAKLHILQHFLVLSWSMQDISVACKLSHILVLDLTLRSGFTVNKKLVLSQGRVTYFYLMMTGGKCQACSWKFQFIWYTWVCPFPFDNYKKIIY